MTDTLQRSNAPRAGHGIVHLGPGAFFRAFGAIYTAEAMAAGDPTAQDWGITAVSLRSAGLRDKLAPQGYAYTSVSLAPEGAEHRTIEVIETVLVAAEDPQAVLDVLTAASTRIVSLTITEKGYCHNPASGTLDMGHSDIAHDLSHAHAPRSAVGFVVYALAKRRAEGRAPFTILSCDNLPENGVLTRGVVLQFAQAMDPDLADWIAQNARFPSTMVDRITPATTAEDVAAVASATGFHDAAPVMHEPFRQWVVEDDFVSNQRPQWEKAGAQMVRDVAPFEAMKLRCLNGTHSTLAYLGYLSGFETIAQTVAEPAFTAMLERMWRDEIVPTLAAPEGADLSQYCKDLMTRYQNPSIRHRTWQIAMDGSQKLPQRLLGTVRDNLAADRSISLLALAVAGWMRYVGGVDEQGRAIDVKDPLADRLRAAYDSDTTPAERANALLAIEAVFDPDLAANPRFRAAMCEALERVTKLGALGAVKGTI